MESRLERLQIPVPNPVLAEWLNGPQCRRMVETRTAQVYSVYVSLLPVITGNLVRGAYWHVGRGGWGPGESDRWFGWVGNSALSYRKTRGQPYPRVIEWGKASRGIPGQGQLRLAGSIVLGSPAPALRTAVRSGRAKVQTREASGSGRFAKSRRPQGRGNLPRLPRKPRYR